MTKRTLLIEWSEYGNHRAREIEKKHSKEIIEQFLCQALEEYGQPGGVLEHISCPEVETSRYDDLIGWDSYSLNTRDVEGLDDGWTWVLFDEHLEKVIEHGYDEVPHGYMKEPELVLRALDPLKV